MVAPSVFLPDLATTEAYSLGGGWMGCAGPHKALNMTSAGLLISHLALVLKEQQGWRDILLQCGRNHKELNRENKDRVIALLPQKKKSLQ